MAIFKDIIIKGHSPTILMEDEPHSKSYTEKSLQQIANDVIGKFSGQLVKP